MSRPIVIDSSALIASVKMESGAETVRSILKQPGNELVMHTINISEVAYQLLRFGLPPLVAFRLAVPRDTRVYDMVGQKLWERIAVLKTEYSNLSLADCVAIALAESINGEVLTGDKFFIQVDTIAHIRLFR